CVVRLQSLRRRIIAAQSTVIFHFDKNDNLLITVLYQLNKHVRFGLNDPWPEADVLHNAALEREEAALPSLGQEVTRLEKGQEPEVVIEIPQGTEDIPG